MPVPTHMKIVVRGVFNATPEEWTYSMKFSRDNDGVPDAGIGDINQGDVTAALTAFHASSLFTAQVWVTGWRAYVIGEDGTMEGNPLVVEYTTGQYIKGLVTVRYSELDTSACITTVAGDRGPARFGRFFVPAPAMAVQADGRWGVSDVTAMLTAATTMAKAVSDAIDLEATTSSSMLNISDVGTGAKQIVKRMKCGRVPDSQRRRRRSLLEEYIETGDIDW